MTKAAAILVAATCATLLAACGGETAVPAPSTFGSVDEIGEKLTKSGVECLPTLSDGKFGVEGGHCTESGKELVIIRFSDGYPKREYLDFYRDVSNNMLGRTGYLAEGENWVVNCGSSANCASIADILGGQVWTSDDSPSSS